MNRLESAPVPDRPSSLAVRRIVIMLAVGAVCAVATGLLGSWWYAGVVGWPAACILYIAWVWLHLWPLDSDAMRSHATREDPGILVSDLLIIGASIASASSLAAARAVARSMTSPSFAYGASDGFTLSRMRDSSRASTALSPIPNM